MRNGYDIGRRFGVDLSIDRPWPVVPMLLTWQLSSMPTTPGWSLTVTRGMAIGVSAVLFASVQAHEAASPGGPPGCGRTLATAAHQIGEGGTPR